MSKKKTRDEALATARQLVDRAVCECGDTVDEHGIDLSKRYRAAACGIEGCTCEVFRPVTFTVERK